MSNNILILGGTGKTGKRAADRLYKMNLPVRIGSRSANPKFEWNDSSTWSEALKGVSKVYITYQPDLAVPGAVETIQSFVNMATDSGVQKLVLLSGRGEKEAQLCEDIVIDTGLDWTIVRASWFMQNFTENFLLDSVLAGHVLLPKVSALEPFVDVDDIADVVAAALANNIHSKKIFELTGPELLSFEKTVATISTVINRPIIYQEVSMDEYVPMLRTYHIPEDFISLIKYLFTEVLDGRNESLSNDIEIVLGRKPNSFETYAANTNKTGIWSQPN